MPSIERRRLQYRGGWIKLWRQVFSNAIWYEMPHPWFRVWIALLGCANHELQTVTVKGSEVPVAAGSLIIGTIEFSEFCGITRQQLRTALDYLSRTNAITIQTTTRYTLVSISNWEAYQGGKEANNQPQNQPETPATTNGITTKEEVKETNPCGVLGDPDQPFFDGLTPPEPPSSPAKTKRKKREYSPLVEKYAMRLYERHPAPRRDCPGEVKSQLAAILAQNPESDHERICHEIDVNHEAMCRTEGWTKEGGRYAKGLRNWLSPSIERWKTAACVSSPAVPLHTLYRM